MADTDNTEWVLVKHVRLPIPTDEVVGRYPTREDALSALIAINQHSQWFTTYGIEHRRI